MTPAASGVVSLEVARLAVDVQAIKGELALVTSTVGQSIQTLTTLVHEVQAEQLRSRDDRAQQIGLLTGLTERTSAIPVSVARMQELELRVAHWRGVFVGFSVLATVVAGLAVAWVTGQLDIGTAARAKLEQRIERLEQRP